MKKLLLAIFLLIPIQLWAADSKVTDLTATTSPVSADILYIVTDVGTTPASKKVTVGNLSVAVGTLIVGGSDTQVQFNDGGAFGGDAGLTFNKTTNTLTADAFVGTLTGNVTGNLTGNVTGNVSGSSGSTTGNAATATALAANGSNCSAGNAPLGVDASGAVESCFDVATQTELNTHGALTGTSAHGATTTNTADQIVARDSSGNFAAGTITATLTGNVTGNLTGNVTGNASTATALATNPVDCGTGAYADRIAANGDLTCEILIVTATVDPTTDDDTDDLYIIGTKWINTTDGTIFIAQDVTAAAAVWRQIYPATASEADTLDTVFDRGKTIDGANSSANAVLIGNGTVHQRFYCDGSNICWHDTDVAADVRTVVQTNQTWCLYDLEGTSCIETVDPDGASTNAIWQYASAYRPKKSIWFGAGSLSTDGTQCAAPAEVTPVASGPKVWSIICADNAASTIYGSVRMPDSWDGGTVTFTHVYQQTAADTGVLNGDISCQARSNGEAPSSTYGTAIAIDDAAVVGSGSNDMTTSAAVTCAGTGVAGGDMLYFKYVLDTATTSAVATLHHLGFNLEYSVSSRSD